MTLITNKSLSYLLQRYITNPALYSTDNNVPKYIIKNMVDIKIFNITSNLYHTDYLSCFQNKNKIIVINGVRDLNLEIYATDVRIF